MPNYVQNRTLIAGTKENVINFLNKVANKKATLDKALQWNAEEWFLHILNINTKQELTLRSWYRLPKTFKKWDTTNNMLTLEQFKRLSKNDGWAEEVILQEYEKYCNGWKNAKNYQVKNYGVYGWYDYNIKTLGCKWDCYVEMFFLEMRNDKIIIELRIESPWSSPTEWFEKVSLDYNLLVVNYADEEVGFFNDAVDFSNNRYIIYDVLEQLRAKGITYDAEDYCEQLEELKDVANEKMYNYLVDKLAE